MMRGALHVFWALCLAQTVLGKSCGDTLISSNSDGISISSCSKIEGDVTISSDYFDTGSLTLYNVKEITGSLNCTGAENLLGIEADDLETIGGSLSVKSAHALTSLFFPKLSDVGLLELDTIPSLDLLNVSDEITSMGENRITDCGLLSLEGLNPKSIGSLEVSENTDLNEITFNDLKSASGPLSFSSNAKNLSLGLFNLANGSNISVSDAEKIDLRSLRYLTGALTLDGNTINSFNMPNLTQVGGNLAILNNPHLDFLKFWALQTINGDLSIKNNTDLKSLEFKELFSIKGDVTFSGISNISMSKIKSISGTVRMSGPNLDCASLEKTKYAQKANKFECKVTNNTTNSTHDSENSKSSSESGDPESSEGSEESGLSSGAKAGIGIGVAAGVLAIVAILSIFVYKRRQKKRLQQLEKHGNKPPVEVGGITQVEAPGTKSEMAAELEARAKANQNPVELE